jgi:hypothetical protein
MNDLDPCCAFGFLIKDENDFNEFKVNIEAGIKLDGEFGVFNIIADRSDYTGNASIISMNTFKSSNLTSD